NITPAALFRAVERFQPTLLVDELETFLEGHEELRGVLNGGHVRRGAKVVRTVGEDFEPRIFSVWAPKALAYIGRLPGTLEDRSIRIPMRRRAQGEVLERFRIDRLEDFQPLRRRSTRWSQDNLPSLRISDPIVPAQLDDRAADNWRPLFAI